MLNAELLGQSGRIVPLASRSAAQHAENAHEALEVDIGHGRNSQPQRSGDACRDDTRHDAAAMQAKTRQMDMKTLMMKNAVTSMISSIALVGESGQSPLCIIGIDGVHIIHGHLRRPSRAARPNSIANMRPVRCAMSTHCSQGRE
jgi:hypothetical protein